VAALSHLLRHLSPKFLRQIILKATPEPSFVLKDTVGEMYFCNLRCFCVWSVQLATRPNLSAEVKTCTYSLTTPSGEEHQFTGIVDVARWATATAFE
jgi:hypothetical protein